ncbi:MAG: GNAT family N-acetyltransferase [Bryobacteraceae bacterium]|nr:GNAT family N-acetyltransferase [Bryobacteraceae bacterium]
MIHDATAPELASPEAFEAFLGAFHNGAIPHAEWTHAAHVAMAAGLLQRMPKEEALDTVRAGIHNLLRHFGVETTLERGYHESLTRLWLHVSDAFLHESGLEGMEAVRALVNAYGRRGDLHREYYTYDVVRNPDARYGWQPPDLRPIPTAWRRGALLISTNPRLLHVPSIHAFLTESYWAAGIPKTVVERALRGSLCFGVYENCILVGFARVVTDLATFAYLADVFVLPSHRGRGLSRWLMDCITAHPSLQGFRRWHLATKDAHGLYKRYGFRSLTMPERHMEIVCADVYAKSDS